MANILKQSTQIKVRVGPFVDSTDAVTPETGVSLSAADQAELLKADGAATVDISGATWAAVTGADGWYDLTLTTSHTDTVGELVVVVQDSSVCLPVFARFQVVEEAIYDAMFATSATGLLPANVTQISGDSTAADNLEAALDGTGSVTISADLSGSVTNVTGGINTAAGTITTLDALDTAQDSQHATTQAAIPSAGTVADAVLDEALSGHVTAGTLGKAIADIETDATAILADTGTDGVVVASIAANAVNASALAADAVNEIVDQVWTEAIADHSGTAGSTAEALNAAGAAGDPWTTSLPGSYTGTQAGKILADVLTDTGTTIPATLTTLSGYVDTEVAAIKAVTDNLPDSGALTSLATAAAVATVDTVVDAIKVKTDSLTFTAAGNVDANIQYVNDVQVTGNGTSGNEWGPV